MPSPSVALLRTQSDDRLVALAAAGHERAFEAIVERYRRPLLRHCRRYLPEARAEDALQQALVSAWTALRRGDEVQALRPWLYRIVHNTALNALRAAGYDYEELREILLPTDPRGGPAELAEHRAVVQRTLAGLAALPERQREALLQIAVEGRSQDEVAEGLGLTQGAVRQLVHRARTTLRTAATAVVPLPLAVWLAGTSAERGDLAARLGELVTGAGASATIAKAGAVAVLAGGAVGGPAVVSQLDDGKRAARASAAQAGGKADAAPRREAAPDPTVAPVAPAAAGPAPVVLAAAAGGGASSERARDHGDRDRADRRDGGQRRGAGRSPGAHGDDERGRGHGRDDDRGHGHDDDGGEREPGGERKSGDDDDGERGSGGHDRRGGRSGGGGSADDGDDGDGDDGNDGGGNGGDDSGDDGSGGSGGGSGRGRSGGEDDGGSGYSGGGSLPGAPGGSGDSGADDGGKDAPAAIASPEPTPSITPEDEDDDESGG